MTTIDKAKLARLQMVEEDLHAMARGLAERYDDDRQGIAQRLLFLGSGLSTAAARHWRPGDDIAQLLDLPDDVRATLQQEVAQAEQIQALKAHMAAIQERRVALTAEIQATSALMRKLEEYARDHP